MRSSLGRRSLLAGGALMAALVVGIFSYNNPWYLDDGLDPGTVMSVKAAHEKASTGEITLIDVRYPREWRKTGIPASGHAITMHQDEKKFISALAAAAGGDKSKPLAVICAVGGRTTYLQDVLKKNGFTNPVNVAAGMLGSDHGVGWLDAKLPTRTWDGSNVAPQTESKPAAVNQ